MAQNKIVRYILVALASAAFSIAATLYAEDQLSKSWTIPSRAYLKISQFVRVHFGSTLEEEHQIITNRLKLRVETVNLPSADYGGGLSPIDEQNALLVDRIGQFFIVHSKGYKLASISAPENGLETLRSQLGHRDFANYTVDFKNFRYNDVEIIRRTDKRTILLSYTEWFPEKKCFTSTLARYDYKQDKKIEQLVVRKSDWKIVKRTAPCLQLQKRPLPGLVGQEAAGRIAPLADPSHVAWSVGQYESGDNFVGEDYDKALGLRDGSEYGRILEVDIDTGKSREISRGLRNPQGIAISPSGQIWVTDHGQRGGDELNIATDGTNFGYPAVSYGTAYDGQPIGGGKTHRQHDGYDPPEFAFVPSIGPSSLLFLRDFHYLWDGNLLIGSYNKIIYRAQFQGERIVYLEPIPVPSRVRDLVQIGNGKIVVWTDERRVHFISPSTEPSNLERVENRIDRVGNADLRDSARAALKVCVGCHSLEPGEQGRGPSLAKVCGSRAASSGFGDYSKALATSGITWDASSIAKYIQDPQGFIKGTTMNFLRLDDEQVSLALSTALCPKILN